MRGDGIVYINISIVIFLYRHRNPVLIRGLYVHKADLQEWFLGK